MTKDLKILGFLIVAIVILTIATFTVPTIIKLEDLNIFIRIRLPKYGMALLAGGGLAVAGYLSQLLLSNPLADPYVLGISGGASVGINLAFFLGLPFFAGGVYLPYGYALVGAVLVSLIVFYRFKQSNGNTLSLLLIGLAINFFASALVSLLMFLSEDSNMVRDMSFWFMGSYSRASLNDFLIVSAISIIMLVIVFSKSEVIYKLHLGVKRASELGLKVQGIQNMMVVLITIFTVLIVSICGPIGFVGLIIPHFVRELHVSKAYILPVAFLMGGGLTLAAELAATFVFPSIGLPPGVVTSLLGIPVFVYLLKNNYQFQS